MSYKSSILATSTTNFIPTILFLFSLFSTYKYALVSSTHDINDQVTPRPNRELWSIIIGGDPPITIGGGSPPPENSPPPPQSPCPPPTPPPAPCPPPPTPTKPPSPPPPKPPSPPTPTDRVAIATKTIQQFIQGIDTDSCNLTKSKTTKKPDFCKNAKFGCAFLNKYKQPALYAIQFNECFIKGKTISLDNFINKLPDVSIFHANSNNFCGKIPVLSNLPYLYELDLSNNKYTGKFPVNILGAINLTFLDIRFNSFEGPVPPQLFDLQVLALFINNNNFEEELPYNLGSTPAAFLTLANNKFTGPIPRSIGKASKTLLEVLFLNNKLSGCLPYEIGLLKKTRVFDVSKNTLTGPIPKSFGCLGKMQYLVLAQNKFYGPIPEEVCKLPLLRQFNLSDNYFTQAGPECMKLVRKKILDVSNNCILGLPCQKSPEVCASFFNEPKTCGESKMFNYVPCKNTAAYLNSEVSLEGVPQPQPTFTYGALTPNNRN